MVASAEVFSSHPITSRHNGRVPTTKPPFTLSQLKKAIPPHCFRRSLPRSLFYLLSDLSLCSALLFIAIYHLPSHLTYPYSFLSWSLFYWIPQGLTLAGLWILGHELGHHAFSDYQLLDDILGFIIHSFLLVPYYSWKISHRHHHSNTGSLERDEVFLPQLKSSLPWFAPYLDNPIGRFIYISLCLTVGWPLYLAINASGRNYPRFTSHFDPYGPIFTGNQRSLVFASDAGILAVCYALYRLSVAYSFGWIVMIYGVPLMIMGGCLVLITFLQHTHVELPHYDSMEWDWLRGALSTVDRDYGRVMNWRFHNCGTTHIVHHLFSTLPHYHGKEATKALKVVLGDYYKFDSTPVLKAIWRETKECLFVEEENGRKGVFWYNNKL